MLKNTGFLLISPVIFVLMALPARASTVALNDPQALVCRGLNMVGMACGTNSAPAGYQPVLTKFTFDPFNRGPSSNETGTVVNNAKAPRDLNGQKINIVSVAESPEIYALINGQKHAFPSLAVYYDYGYTLAMIQPITQDQLDKYPRAKLLKVKGDSKIYYLTEGGMVRIIPNPKKILEIYGDREGDIITISRKEFNYYPANEYVYQISPYNRDVFQITEKGKRYLTPMAVLRLGIRQDQVAPVIQAELNSYKTLAPVID